MFFKNLGSYYIVRALDHYFLLRKYDRIKVDYDILKMGSKEEIYYEMENIFIKKVKKDVSELFEKI